MSDPIIELDNHFHMNTEEAIARAQREGLKKVIIVGLNRRNKLMLISSDMQDQEAFWALSKAAQAIFDG